jgi:hypothetical protein
MVKFTPSLWQRLTSDNSLRSTIFAFTLTRAIVFIILIFGTYVKVVEPNRIFAVEAEEVQITLAESNLLDKLRPLAMRGDGGWYLHIADRGYERMPFEKELPHNWAFFPLFPMLWRAATFITGGFALTGILLSNILFFLALFVLHRTGLAYGLEAAAADRALLYIAAFPTGYFFSLPMAESLFLLLTSGTFLAARRRRWIFAALLAALAATTRFSGLLLLPVLWLLQCQSDRSVRPSAKTLTLAIVPLGLLGFMGYLYSITGNALAFAAIEPAWGRRPQLFVLTLFEYLRQPLEVSYKWNFKLFNFLVAILAFACAIILLKRRQWAFGFYVLACVILPLSSGTLQSMGRYMMVVFPIFFVLAEAGRRPLVDRTILVVSGSLLAIMTLLCAIIVTIALS